MSGEVNRSGKGLGKPWQPGQSGNPNGRPKRRKFFTDALIDRLEEHKDLAYNVVDALISDAQNGGRVGIAAAEVIWDRLEGPVTADIAKQAQLPAGAVIIIPANGREQLQQSMANIGQVLDLPSMAGVDTDNEHNTTSNGNSHHDDNNSGNEDDETE
jgi:hypothetical protein